MAPKYSRFAKKLYLAQEGKCFHCGHNILPYVCSSKSTEKGWTIEHVVPQSYEKKLGVTLKFNIVLVHKKCNRKKGNKFPKKKEVHKLVEIYKKILNFQPILLSN